LPFPTVDIGGLLGPDGTFHPIEYDLGSELTERDPDEAYRIFAIKYVDALQATCDGALFEIDPNGATPIMHITQPGYTAIRQVVEGSGTALCILPTGQIKSFELNATNGGMLSENEGWIDCWIAGPEGMKIIDMSNPGFQLDFETSIRADSDLLPAEYWAEYHRLLGR
jgi:hypothetical protein